MAEALLKGAPVRIDIGGYAPPQDISFSLGRIATAAGGTSVINREFWYRYTDHLLQTTAKNGGWSTKARRRVRPWLQTYLEQRAAERVARLKEMNRLQDDEVDKHYKHVRNSWIHRYAMDVDSTILPTAYAAFFIAEGARPPLAASWQWGDQPVRSELLPPVVQRLQREHMVNLRLARLTPQFPALVLEDLPALHVSGTGTFQADSEEAFAQVAEYLDRGGLLLAEAPATDPGMAFLASLAERLQASAVGFVKRTVPPKGDMPEVTVVSPESGAGVGALLLPLAAGSAQPAGALERRQALHAVYNVLLKTIDAAILEPGIVLDREELAMLEQAEKEREIAERDANLEGLVD
jgi:hypothetical protein